ncbi:MAG: polysaccharide deacetylase family protein [Anaerolineales bacterium]|nr:polysaccharide deacetylase family protein [Anaerolineales bacterium]
MKLPHLLFTFVITILLIGCSAAPAAQTKEPRSFKNTVVSLTFDDGDADNYQVRDILAENNLRATFYVISGFTGTAGYMTADQLRGLHQDGNEIGGHTLSHTKLSAVRGADLKREICQDRLNLLAYNFDVTSFAYPYGYYDEKSKQTAIECGYNNARIVSSGPAVIPPVDAYALPAMPYIVSDTRFAKMTRYVTQVEDAGGGWSIFVFHHVCDGCDQFSVSLETFSKFAQWLGEQQKTGLVVKTVGEAVGGEVKPGVAP